MVGETSSVPQNRVRRRLNCRIWCNMMPRHLERPSPSCVTPALSPRQIDVVTLVAQGLTNQQIARNLSIGVDTVKKHLTQALRVSGCRNRTQLALWWLS